MAAIFTGLGAGLARGSGSVIGPGGVLGSGTTGRSGEGLAVNAATGNLVINRQDEFLSGPGLDVGLTRTYNSFAEAHDGDNGDKWQLSTARRVFGLTGSLNTAGSTIRRLASDGSVSTYLYETRSGVAAYWTTDGAGAHDKLTVSGSRWTWTDGDTQVTESYDADPYAAGDWRLVAQTDPSGQSLSFTYSGSVVVRVTTGNNDSMVYDWAGDKLSAVSLHVIDPATGGVIHSTRTRYTYDGAGRLASVTTDLSPEDNSISDGRSYTTSYSYDGNGRIAAVTQTDGSRTDIAYDGAGRVASLTEVVGDGTSRVTSLVYHHVCTDVTGPDGQTTRLGFSTGGNTVYPLLDWGHGGVSREAAGSIDGEAAFKYTSSPGVDWSGVSAGLTANTGDSYKFTVSLKAVAGHATEQMLGIYGSSTGWGELRYSSARIVSGPGQLSQWAENGGFWRVTGLSDTVATKIEIIRTFDRAEGGGAYFYVDQYYGTRDGQALIAAGATLEKLAEDTYSAAPITSWSHGGASLQPSGSLNGYPAAVLTSLPGYNWSAAELGYHVRQGETIKLRFLLQAVAGHATSQAIGLYGNITGWHDHDLSQARIVSGPGTIRQYHGGLWQVDGLDSTQPTEIEIIRTFDREEYGGVYAYVDMPGDYRDNQQVIFAAKSITKLVDWHHADKQLTHIVAPPAYAGAAQQVQEFTYDKDGNLVRTLSPNGQTSHFAYDDMGNLTLVDNPLGTDIKRWYDTKNRLILEESFGSNINYDSVSHYNAYAYDGAGRLRYKVAPDGLVTEFRYDGYGRVLEEVAYRAQSFPYPTVWIDEATMNAWRDGLGDKTLRNITSHRYDARGNLAYSYEWSATNSNGDYISYHGYTLTYYTYDANGRLLAKYKSGETGETFLYDGLDRVIGSSSAESGVTTIFFDDAATRTVMHLSSGLTKTLTYNKAGDLISEVSSAPGANHPTGSTDLVAHWGYGGVVREGSSSTTGAAAYRYHSPNGDSWRGVSTGFGVSAGETVRVRMSIRSDGTTSTHSLGLHSSQDSWGSTGDGQAQAVIVSGPGVLRQAVGGLWYIDGISTTTETTVEIVRKYSHAASAGAYLYVGGHGSAPPGTGVILSSPSITVTRVDATAIATETLNSYDKLGRLRVSLDNFDNGNRSYFVYDKAGRLVGELDDYGALTEYRYDSNNRLIQTSRYAGAVNAAYTQLQDPNNTITIDQLRPAGMTGDIHAWTIYDANDRVVQTINGTGAVTAFEYDGMGRVVRTTIYANQVTISGYPVSPVAVSADPARDAVTRTFYDRQGNVRGVLDGEGYLTENVYDAAGRLIETIAYAHQVAAVYRATYSFSDIKINAAPTSGDNRHTRYVYDAADQLRFKVDAQNRATEYSYDAAGRLTRTVERFHTISVPNWEFETVWAAAGIGHDDQRITYTYYDRNGRVVRTTDPVGVDTYLTYDQAGNVIKTQVGDGGQAQVTRNWYDARGMLRFSIDAGDYLTRYSYSTGGRLTQVSRFDTAVVASDASTIQDIAARATGEVIHTTYQYDNVGRVTKQYNGNQEFTQYAHNRLGQLTETRFGRTDATNADESIHVHDYDAAGRNYATYQAVGENERGNSYAYSDARGNVIRTDDARGKISYAEYDRRGMLVSTTDANGGVVRYQYNAFGEVTALTDARGHTTTSGYNTLGQLIRTIDAAATQTDYTYTRFGELSTVTKAGATTTFSYDKMGRVTRSTDALGGIESYAYDAWGNRTQLTNKLGGVTHYGYDRLGRLLNEWVDAAAYNNDGNVTVQGYFKTIYEYDAHGNVKRRIQGYSQATALSERIDTTYDYDRANRLIKQTDPAPHGYTAVTQYRYDARGNLTSKVAPDGGRTVYYYDDLDRVTVEISPTGTFTTYGYDANGNVTRIRVFEVPASVPADGGSEEEQPAAPGANYRETVFEYDTLNRMTSSTVTGVQGRVFDGANYVSQGSGLQTRYQYDANGNVTLTIDPNGNTTYAYYDALGRKYLQVDSGGYRTDWTYDANGNVTREWRYANAVDWSGGPPAVTVDNDNDRVTDYTYDANGNRKTELRRLVLQHDGIGNQYRNHVQVSYLYNALGQVTRKSEATGDLVNYEYDNTGRLMREIKGRLVNGVVVDAYTDFGGAAVSPRIEYRYDAVGNLTRTVQAGNGNVADRVTTYWYEGGKLRLVGDAEYNSGSSRDGRLLAYWYDLAGNVVTEYYERYNSDGTLAQGAAYDGTQRTYDAEGRVTQEWVAQYRYNSSLGYHEWHDVSPRTTTTYNAYGEVAAVSTGGGATRYNWYDAAGRLVRTNGDGTWKYFDYDKNGNQTAMVESAGYDLSWHSFDPAHALSSRADINTTYTTYDARNLAKKVYEEGRDLSEGVSGQMLVSHRFYNAFGEVGTEYAADGARIDYYHNTMGKVIRIENPQVTIQNEDGSTQLTYPTEHFYYDQSGRLVAQRDANGNLTRLHLLAGTGYDGSQALVTHEVHADGGTIYNYYDAQGDLRTTLNEVGRTVTMAYDRMGRLVQKTDYGSGLIDYYTYDGLGHQLTHWNSLLGSGDSEVSDYDYAGRVISQRSFGGDVTNTVYTWFYWIGGVGGWQETVSTAADRASTGDNIHASVTNTDMFGRLRWSRDKSFTASSHYYDFAGRLSHVTNESTGARQDYTYYNTGKLRSLRTGDAEQTDTNWTNRVTLYGYDAAGRLTSEKLVASRGVYTDGWTEYPPPPPPDPDPWNPPYPELPVAHSNSEPIYHPPSYNVTRTTLQDGSVNYDALGRMARYLDRDEYGAELVDKRWSYDAKGNVRSILAYYRGMDQYGTLAPSLNNARHHWYRYDAMDRVVISQGVQSGGTIVAGGEGIALGYDQAGRRTWSQTGYEAAEWYGYDGNDRVSSVTIGGVTRAQSSYDALGRIIGHAEYTAYGQLAYERHSFLYDGRGQVLTEKGRTRLANGQWHFTHTNNYYSASGANDGSVYVPGYMAYEYYRGASSGALLFHSETKNWLSSSQWYNPTYPPSGTVYPNTEDGRWADSFADYTYEFTNGPRQLTHTLTNRDGQSRAYSYYDRDGAPSGVTVSRISGTSRIHSVSYQTDTAGQVLTMTDSAGPRARSYLFGGRLMGEVGNNGTANTGYATTIERRDDEGAGGYRGGASYGASHADFDAQHRTLASTAQTNGASYTARGGESLQQVAAAVWGDAGLWYKLASANGLSAGAALAAGQTLAIPAGVQANRHTADTHKPYDPATALGDIHPTTPQPQKQQGNKCGVFGAILLAVVAIAVTVIAPIGGSGIAAAMANAALGSAVSQGVGVATGIQDKFSFKAVALSALSAGVMKGIGGLAPFGEATGRSLAAIGNAAVTGAVGSAVTQGIGMALGLQDKFSWAGVAAAGVAGAVGQGLGGKLPGLSGEGANRSFGNIMAHTGVGAASLLASAATRSALEGSSFGGNIIAGLPDVIGQVVGRAIGSRISDPAVRAASRSPVQAGGGASVDAGPLVSMDEIMGRHLLDIEPHMLPGLDPAQDVTPETNISILQLTGKITPEAATILRSHVAEVKGQLRYEHMANAARSGQPVTTADGLAAQPVGATDIAVSMFELNAWRAGAQAIYNAGDPTNGASYSASFYNELVQGYNANETLIRKWDAIANAEVNKLLFAGIGGPALVASGMIAVPAAAGYAGGFYVGGTASKIASGGAGFVAGGTFGAGFEYSKNRALGLDDTVGGYTTSVLAGGIGGTGLRLLPNTVLGRVVTTRAQTVTLGAFSGFVGDGAGQLVTSGGDRSQISLGQLGLATALGGGLGALTSLEVRSTLVGTAGRNNSLSIYQGLNTRVTSGNITQMQLRYPVTAGAANAVVGSGQQFTGAVIDGARQRAGRR